MSTQSRQASTGTVFGLVGLVCVLVASLTLTVYSLVLASHTHDQSEHFRKAMYNECQRRFAYDSAIQEKITADSQLYASLLASSEQLRASGQTLALPPAYARAQEQQIAAIKAAHAAATKAVRNGVVGRCDDYEDFTALSR